MFVLQSRLKIGFMLKTVEKMADRGTLVRLKEIRPSTGNDVTIQIFNYKIFNWIIHLYRSFFGLTYVFYLKPISLIIFKWQHGKEWQKIAPILGTTNYLSPYIYLSIYLSLTFHRLYTVPGWRHRDSPKPWTSIFLFSVSRDLLDEFIWFSLP